MDMRPWPGGVLHPAPEESGCGCSLLSARCRSPAAHYRRGSVPGCRRWRNPGLSGGSRRHRSGGAAGRPLPTGAAATLSLLDAAPLRHSAPAGYGCASLFAEMSGWDENRKTSLHWSCISVASRKFTSSCTIVENATKRNVKLCHRRGLLL
ncbi:hypothetical protein BS78_03G321600 [Paspalum vaginatum]|nr:hypothetical protein BS78_03G321600 [Paspalum vaginatum]